MDTYNDITGVFVRTFGDVNFIINRVDIDKNKLFQKHKYLKLRYVERFIVHNKKKIITMYGQLFYRTERLHYIYQKIPAASLKVMTANVRVTKWNCTNHGIQVCADYNLKIGYTR